MARVCDLSPGDNVATGALSEVLGGPCATFISRGWHPRYPGLCLVIWAMPDGSFSLDALDATQEVGEVTFSTAEQRWSRVQAAFERPPSPTPGPRVDGPPPG